MYHFWFQKSSPDKTLTKKDFKSKKKMGYPLVKFGVDNFTIQGDTECDRHRVIVIALLLFNN